MEKQRFFQVLAMVALCACLAPAALAEPLSVRIDDYDFTFDTDHVATYAYNGASADTLTVGPGGNEVGSYRFLGADGSTTDMSGNVPGLYSVWASSSPYIFGGDLELSLSFDAKDGPYVSGGDEMEVSLTGSQGFLRITGIIGTPLPTGDPITLLEIEFNATSLLSREAYDETDLIEAEGTVKTLLGEDVSSQGLLGVAKLFFYAEDDVFPAPGGDYNPLSDHGLNSVQGRVSGETGVEIPEPATMTLLGIGALGLLRRRRRK